jgi:hypothetical protein
VLDLRTLRAACARRSRVAHARAGGRPANFWLAVLPTSKLAVRWNA